MQIRDIIYDGAEAVELVTGALRLVAIKAFGPRVAHLSGASGENIFLWEPEKYKRDDWNLRGGHRVWMSRPQGDEAEDTYRPDNSPCELVVHSDGFSLTAPMDPVTKLQRGFRIRVVAEDRLEVDNFLINRSELLFSAGIWALSCTLPKASTKYLIPVGDGSDWDNFQYTIFRCWGGHGQGGINDPQFNFTEDCLEVVPQGLENKRMLQAHKGIIAMVDEDRQQVFAKKAPFDPEHRYPLNSNIAIYIGPDNFMVEMETMGQERTVKPGQSLNMTEEWVLKNMPKAIDSASKIEELFV